MDVIIQNYDINDMNVTLLSHTEVQCVFGKCQKVSIYKECLICEFMLKNGLFLSPSLGDFVVKRF